MSLESTSQRQCFSFSFPLIHNGKHCRTRTAAAAFPLGALSGRISPRSMARGLGWNPAEWLGMPRPASYFPHIFGWLGEDEHKVMTVEIGADERFWLVQKHFTSFYLEKVLASEKSRPVSILCEWWPSQEEPTDMAQDPERPGDV